MEINNNGFDYVDLNLPSGTLWATCNVGANKPSDGGLYFQWGDIKGYTKKQVGKDKIFTWNDYKFSINGSFTNFRKYTTPGATLELCDDAAKILMGGDWHMPTPDQINELINYTTHSWTTQDGISGMLFSSNKDASKSIFIPAAGYAWDGSAEGSGSYGFVWSSTLHPNYVYSSQELGFGSNGPYLNGFNRDFGFSIRGVIG